MTKLAFVAIATSVKEKFPDLSEARTGVSIALGIAVSRMLSLPSGAVQSAEDHWAQSVCGSASDQISEFNEAVVVDVDLVLETARSFWLFRYFSAYPCIDTSIVAGGEFDFFVKLTGASIFMNPVTSAFAGANSEAVLSLVNRITIALKPANQDTSVVP